MTSTSIDLPSGRVTVDALVINGGLTIESFLDALGAVSNRIYGSGGDAKYCLAPTVSLLHQTFLICCLFTKGELRLVELILSDSDSASSPEADDEKVKAEYEALQQLLETELGDAGATKRPFSQSWPFPWGEVSLTHQIQDMSVYVGMTWA